MVAGTQQKKLKRYFFLFTSKVLGKSWLFYTFTWVAFWALLLLLLKYWRWLLLIALTTGKVDSNGSAWVFRFQDHLWVQRSVSQESVGNVRRLQLNLSPGTAEDAANKWRFAATGSGPVCYDVHLYVISCTQRLAVYRTSFERPAWT